MLISEKAFDQTLKMSCSALLKLKAQKWRWGCRAPAAPPARRPGPASPVSTAPFSSSLSDFTFSSVEEVLWGGRGWGTTVDSELQWVSSVSHMFSTH